MRSKNLFKVTLLFLILTFFACNNNNKEIVHVQKASFNQAIIDDLPAYKKLNDLIVEHMDTIVKFRLAQLDNPNKVEELTFFHEKGENDFIQPYMNFNNMPAFILPKLDSAFNAIKKGNISGFSLTNNGMIEMSVGRAYDKNCNCDTYESLIWNMPPNLPLISTARDTALSSECTYVLHVLKRGNPPQ